MSCSGPLKTGLPPRLAAGLVVSSILFLTALAPAADVPVLVGSIGIGKAKPEMEGELRSLLRAELGSAEFSRVRTHERYVLSTTLVRLDSVQSAEAARATCVVSVAILRGGSTLHALVNGRATAEGSEVPTVRRDALRAAVHSAMVRVPKALR